MAAVAELLHHVADFLEDDATWPTRTYRRQPSRDGHHRADVESAESHVQLSEIAVEAEAEVAKEDGQ